MFFLQCFIIINYLLVYNIIQGILALSVDASLGTKQGGGELITILVFQFTTKHTLQGALFMVVFGIIVIPLQGVGYVKSEQITLLVRNFVADAENRIGLGRIKDIAYFIISIDVLYGTEETKPGWAVTKGDLLISGIITRADGKEIFIHADGYVKALVKKKQEFSHKNIALYEQQDEKKRSCIYFFGLKIPLGTGVPESFFTQHKSFLKSEEILLPVGIIREYGAMYRRGAGSEALAVTTME
jgi:hypothetical protein